MQTVQVPQVADEHASVPALANSLSKPDGEGNLNMASAAIMLSASETLRTLTAPSMPSKHSLMIRISPGAPGLRWNRGDCGVDIGTARHLPSLLGPECPNLGGKTTKTSSGVPRSTR